MDHSFDRNDWFNNQPAILFAATIDLPATRAEKVLSFIGWTPNEGTNNMVPGAQSGELQKETRYITRHKDGEGFGEPDPRSSTFMVEQLLATIIAK